MHKGLESRCTNTFSFNYYFILLVFPPLFQILIKTNEKKNFQWINRYLIL